MFRKGVPSLFNSFKDLFLAKSEKCLVIQNVVEDFYTSLLRDGSLGGASMEKEVPSVTVWVLYFLAQLYDRIGFIEKALDRINAAIEHSPTAVELYMTKARIYKVFFFNFPFIIDINSLRVIACWGLCASNERNGNGQVVGFTRSLHQH